MDTVKYEIFLKVLEHRSFSKAANELGYTQSAVSHSISTLEKSFGFKLLNRENNDISLTRAGIDVLPHIRNIVDAQNTLDFTLTSYHEFESGTLCIATIPSLAIQCFPDLLRQFNLQYPKIHIVIIDGNYEEVEEMLAYHRLGINKYKILDIEYPLPDIEEPDTGHMLHLVEAANEILIPAGKKCFYNIDNSADE